MLTLFRPEQHKKIYGKPELGKIPELIKIWSLNPAIQIESYEPITKEDLYKVHDPKFVNGLFLGKVTNGFGDQDPAKALSDLYQVSNYYWGCKRALTEKIVCSPVAGFHHSTYNYAGKFCIFNGLLYAAVRLKEEGLINKVGIIDLDFHYGDGTDDIIHRLGIQYIRHWGFAKNWVPSGVLFLNNLKRALDSFNGCDIIMYQAGMDMFKDDPLGGLLTEDELVKRDLLVFEWAKANGKPICWNLAGGYTSPLTRLVALHNETMNCALKIYPGY